MRFSIGYQLPDEDDSIVEIVRDFPDEVAEVYFAWIGEPSGRSPLGLFGSRPDPEAQAMLESDLAALSDMGVGLVLLLNAACYGDEAISESFAERTRVLVGELIDEYGVSTVTTTSPFVARVIKDAFPEVEVRASVNMRIGTIKGMTYLADLFDGFYVRREFNRDLGHISEVKAWCDKHDKKLHLLANSGCLNYCSFQSFHDNLVAHEAGIRARRNVPTKYPSPCWEFLENPQNWVTFLQGSWIRPEDLKHYARWFSTVKLATRMHASPRKVVAAYARGRFRGSLLDLTEPGYGPLFAGFIIDNTRFPEDWFVRTTECDKKCHQCNYCASVLEKVLVQVCDTWG